MKVNRILELRKFLSRDLGIKNKDGAIAIISQREASEFFGVPLRTWEGWEYGKPPSHASLRWLRHMIKSKGIRFSLE